MTPSVMAFGYKHLTRQRVHDACILELGSADVNGSLRCIAETHGPAEYVGVDQADVKGVDVVGDLEDIDSMVPQAHFDGIICTEAFEHIRQWWEVVERMRLCLKPNGWLLLTARSPGYPLHCYPEDHWRYTVEDIQVIFGSWYKDIWEYAWIGEDPVKPGVMAFIIYNQTVYNTRGWLQQRAMQRRVYNIIEGCTLTPNEWKAIYG